MSYVDKEWKCINLMFFKLVFGLSAVLVSKNAFTDVSFAHVWQSSFHFFMCHFCVISTMKVREFL